MTQPQSSNLFEQQLSMSDWPAVEHDLRCEDPHCAGDCLTRTELGTCRHGGAPKPRQAVTKTPNGRRAVYGWAAGCSCGWQGEVFPFADRPDDRRPAARDRRREAREAALEASIAHTRVRAR